MPDDHHNCPGDCLNHHHNDGRGVDVDYFHDGRTRHDDQHDCDTNHCDDGVYVLVRRTDLDHLRAEFATTNVRGTFHYAARRLLDNSRPAD